MLLTSLVNVSPLGGVRVQILGAPLSFWGAGGTGCGGGDPYAPA